MRRLVFIILLSSVVTASQPPAVQVPTPPAAPPPAPVIVPVRAIEPPATALPSEAASANITKFTFFAYGDTRSGSTSPMDGEVIHPDHSLLVDGMLARAKALASTPYPVRFVVQTGDAVLRGANGAMWNVSFIPVIEKLTQAGNIPYFFVVGNHDVTTMPVGNPARALGLKNTLDAMAKLYPPEGSPRRLNGYATYAFGYGHVFVLMLDSNIAADPTQLAWATAQLEKLDRKRYALVIAVFHHPTFTSGNHLGPEQKGEPPTLAMRDNYLPLFRRHHVRLALAGHDHIHDHWIERYEDPRDGKTYRRDDIVTGGGGAPIYTYHGEPDLTAYLASTLDEKVRLEHLMKPGATIEEMPHHFLVIQIDGQKISVEAVALGDKPYAPYNGKSRIDLENDQW